MIVIDNKKNNNCIRAKTLLRAFSKSADREYQLSHLCLLLYTEFVYQLILYLSSVYPPCNNESKHL